MLSASAAANLLDAGSWSKSPSPVFASNAATSQYGPGHNSFTVSEDGQSDILVYHDRNYRDITGDPLNDPNRRTRLQKVYWNADGTPNFGIPVPDGATPVRLRSHDQASSYIRHYDYRARIEPNVANLADSQFRIVTGLAGGGSVSLESTNFPGYYLRHRGYALYVEKNDGSALFGGDASFRRQSGLADSTGISLESQNFPGRHVRHRDGLLYMEAVEHERRARLRHLPPGIAAGDHAPPSSQEHDAPTSHEDRPATAVDPSRPAYEPGARHDHHAGRRRRRRAGRRTAGSGGDHRHQRLLRAGQPAQRQGPRRPGHLDGGRRGDPAVVP